MRTFALVLTVIAATTAPALADDGEPDYEPLPKLSAAFGLQGHGTRIGGRSEGGFGPTIELGYGRGRWQYVAEGSFATSGMNDWTTPALETQISGHLMRGSLGLRWVARQFQTGGAGAIELLLLSGLGVERFELDDGKHSSTSKLTRPEIALGFAVQGRSFRKPRLAFRIDMRAVFTPNDNESALVSCSGNCMSENGSSTGFLTGIALAW